MAVKLDHATKPVPMTTPPHRFSTLSVRDSTPIYGGHHVESIPLWR
jgi:hypothetical protein